MTLESKDGQKSEKQIAWERKLTEINQITDKLGMPIDEGIKEIVALLQLNGINTTGSHEGKIDRYPIPYVDIESPDIAELEEKFESLEDVDSEEGERLNHKILELNLIERKKLIPLLEEFYLDRTVPYEVRLGITGLARGWSRLESNGADFQEVEKGEKAKKERLASFQEEIEEFKEFLKSKYFAES